MINFTATSVRSAPFLNYKFLEKDKFSTALFFELKSSRNMKRLCNRLLLLDFGHPMDEGTSKRIKISLQNIFTLAAAFSTAIEYDIGIAVINSEYILIESLSTLRKNYSSILSDLETLDKTINPTSKISVLKYKQLLYDSIVKIIQNFDTKRKKAKQGEYFTCSQRRNILIEILVVTKKTASVLRDILKDVLDKLYPSLSSPAISVKNIKIIQLVNENDIISPVYQKNNSIELSTCTDNLHSLEFVFRDWLLKPCREKQIGILLSQELDLIVKCDIEDCILNPFLNLNENKYAGIDLWDEILFRSADDAYPILKPLHRTTVPSLCPTLFFGIPRRIYATTNSELSWTDLEVNQKIFKELCAELLRTQQGLVAMLNLKFGNKDLTTNYFIISDGDSLLLNSLASDEIHFQRRQQTIQGSQTDSNCSSVVKFCLKKVQFMEECLASEFSSGLYDYLGDQLKQAEQKSSFLGHINPDLIQGNYPPKSSKGRHKFKFWSQKLKAKKLPESQSKKRQIEAEYENVHPALLPPSVVKKYRKGHPS